MGGDRIRLWSFDIYMTMVMLAQNTKRTVIIIRRFLQTETIKHGTPFSGTTGKYGNPQLVDFYCRGRAGCCVAD